MNSEQKFCRDCRWMRLPESGSIEFARCTHVEGIDRAGPDLVSGEPVTEHMYCSVMRSYMKCGKEALLWEPKP